jgi:hypothetical protein
MCREKTCFGVMFHEYVWLIFRRGNFASWCEYGFMSWGWICTGGKNLFYCFP